MQQTGSAYLFVYKMNLSSQVSWWQCAFLGFPTQYCEPPAPVPYDPAESHAHPAGLYAAHSFLHARLPGLQDTLTWNANHGTLWNQWLFVFCFVLFFEGWQKSFFFFLLIQTPWSRWGQFFLYLFIFLF